MAEFLQLTAGVDSLDLATNIYKNRGRTSPRGEIHKAEAVQRYCVALHASSIDSFADMAHEDRVAAAWNEIRTIPGHASSIAFDYFRMLAGSEDVIKPDTRLRAFVTEALVAPSMVGARQAREHIMEAYEILRLRMPGLTPRQIDYAIWSLPKAPVAPPS